MMSKFGMEEEEEKKVEELIKVASRRNDHDHDHDDDDDDELVQKPTALATKRLILSLRECIATDGCTEEEVLLGIRMAMTTVFPQRGGCGGSLDNTEEKKTKKKTKVRAYFDGCFDLTHSGHYNALRQARSLCDELVVGVHTDDEIERNKGCAPVMNNEERLNTVRSCKWVDEIFFGAPYSPGVDLLDELNCDFAIHGDDMPVAADGSDAFRPLREAGRLQVVRRTDGVSTTNLVTRLLLATSEKHGVVDLMEREAGGKNTVVYLSPPTPDSPPCTTMPFLPMASRLSQFAMSTHRRPRPEDRVVYVGGSFDIFHTGHLDVLEHAASLGNYLCVGVYDDDVVRERAGSAYHPFMTLHERALSVLSCKFVDDVIVGVPGWAEPPKAVREALNVSVVGKVPIKLETWHNNNNSFTNTDMSLVVEDDNEEDIPNGTVEIVHLQYVSKLTTLDVVKRIIENRKKYEERNKTRGPREEKYVLDKTYIQEI